METAIEPRTCRRCGETKPGAEFEKVRKICRECRRQQIREFQRTYPRETRNRIGRETYERRKTRQAAMRIVCTECGAEKPGDEFYVGKSRCKECYCLAKRARRKEDPTTRARESMNSRASRERHRDRRIDDSRAWYYANRDRAQALGRRSARRREGMTVEQLDYCDLLEACPCVYCGKDPALGVDHVVPQVRGGSHESSNLVPCCKWCNGAKRDLPVLEFLARRFAAATIG